LIVDDHPRVREALSIVLAGLGDIRTAANGQEALLALEDFPADAIVLELHMPVMNGREFASRYRRCPGSKAAILLLSADRDIEQLAKDIGADAWMAKGADAGLLYRQVAALMTPPGLPRAADDPCSEDLLREQALWPNRGPDPE